MEEVGGRPSGMRAFYVIWFGQVVSLLGTGMTRFALTLWAWDLTGEATALALVALFSFAPGVILSPIAGALVDRWNRKLVMMLSDLAAGLATIFMFALSLNGSLEIWHVYVAAAFASAFESFQFPAYSSAITMMVDKTQYARTSAMLGLADAASGILAPIFGVALFTAIELKGVLLFDKISFTCALWTLLFV
jgi:MFS family permease